jgi:predicted dehydrogenase
MPDTIRIGVIGAGDFARRRQIPAFKRIAGVEVVAIANRSLASAEQVAREFDIPNAIGHWRDLLAREDVDAVLIGTPPYAHCEIACAALDAGKDVLCQTRMSVTVAEARQMLRKLEETGRKAGLVGGRRGMSRYVKQLLADGYIGNVRQVFAYRFISDYADSSQPMARRQDADLFGPFNALSLGGNWDTMRDWFGEARRVFAQGLNFTPQRRAAPEGPLIEVRMPEAITAIAEMASGASITSVQSGVAHFGDDRTEVYGDEGTLVLKGARLLGGRRGDKELAPLALPAEFAGSTGAEEDFIRLLRGEIDTMALTFADGVKNIEYIEACGRSASEGRWVELP